MTGERAIVRMGKKEGERAKGRIVKLPTKILSHHPKCVNDVIFPQSYITFIQPEMRYFVLSKRYIEYERKRQ